MFRAIPSRDSRFRARKSFLHQDRHLLFGLLTRRHTSPYCIKISISRIWTQLRLTDGGLISVVTRNVSPSRALPVSHKCLSSTAQVFCLMSFLLFSSSHNKLSPLYVVSDKFSLVIVHLYSHRCELLIRCTYTKAVSLTWFMSLLFLVSHPRRHSSLSRVSVVRRREKLARYFCTAM